MELTGALILDYEFKNFKRFTSPSILIADSKTCEQLKEALVTGHSKLCPWPDNPSPGK